MTNDSTQAFTPGPWRIRTDGNIGNAIEAQSGRKSHEIDNGFRTIALFMDCCSSPRADEQEANRIANAHLITAAPDMYEALKTVLEADTEGHMIPKFVVTAARVALLKAVGGAA